MRKIEPGPGEESVWDYPRPPRLESTTRHLVLRVAGVVVADTCRGLRVLETSHPPVYYFPPEDVRMDLLRPAARRSFCEWKGQARYWDLVIPADLAADGEERPIPLAAWSYPEPVAAYAALKDHLAFYPSKMDECRVDGELARAQEGDFYGGWITDDIVGPFKGGAGTVGW